MSKFSKGDHVRVTATEHAKFDRVGVVDSAFKDGRHWEYTVQFGNLYMPIPEHHLILAIPPVTEVLDQMDAESKVMPTDQMPWAKKRKQILDAADAPCISAEQWAKAVTPPRKDMAEMEIDGEYVREKACVSELPKTGVTAVDKLRMIADTVEGQAPFGTELANFRRRLFAILSIGHDA